MRISTVSKIYIGPFRFLLWRIWCEMNSQKIWNCLCHIFGYIKMIYLWLYYIWICTVYSSIIVEIFFSNPWRILTAIKRYVTLSKPWIKGVKMEFFSANLIIHQVSIAKESQRAAARRKLFFLKRITWWLQQRRKKHRHGQVPEINISPRLSVCWLVFCCNHFFFALIELRI